MALIWRSAAFVFALAVAAVVAGCSAGPAATSGKRATPSRAIPVSAPARTEEPSTPAPDGRSFSHTSAALRAEIAARAEAMQQGPIGNRGAELASLRLAASGRDLIDAGSFDGALEVLRSAVSLYGRNGYAYLYLAYVNHVQGREDQATEFASNARRYLPRDKEVGAELEGLTVSILESAATAGS